MVLEEGMSHTIKLVTRREVATTKDKGKLSLEALTSDTKDKEVNQVVSKMVTDLSSTNLQVFH